MAIKSFNIKAYVNSPLLGISFHRPEQTDFDGEVSYSVVVSVERGELFNKINTYPNPANNYMIIDLKTSSEDVKIFIYNGHGQQLGLPMQYEEKRVLSTT